MPSNPIQGRGSLVTELPGGFEDPQIPEVEKLLDQIARRDKLIAEQIKQMNDDRNLMNQITPRLAYLTTLLIAINDNETTKAQFEELLMTLALTVPDRQELVKKMHHVSPKYLLTFLEDSDLK